MSQSVRSGAVIPRRRTLARSLMKSGALGARCTPLHHATRGPPLPQAGEESRLHAPLCQWSLFRVAQHILPVGEGAEVNAFDNELLRAFRHELHVVDALVRAVRDADRHGVPRGEYGL